MSGAQNSSGEKSNRSLVSGSNVRLREENARVGAPCNALGAPHLQLIRDGKYIKAIEVTCGCGKRIRLRCVQDTQT
jgi:hypothetical protein